jgi:hypothetical protein
MSHSSRPTAGVLRSPATMDSCSWLVIALTEEQLNLLMCASRRLGPERRSQFLERVAAMLRLKGRFDDRDVATIVERALVGLLHQHEPVA